MVDGPLTSASSFIRPWHGTWDRGPEFGPHWYPLALVATALPCAWAGGLLHRKRSAAAMARGPKPA